MPGENNQVLHEMAADLVLLVHLGFIVFVVLGGLLALRYRWMAYLHIPAALWGAFVEISGRICPLTIWENDLRRSAGEFEYAESFIEHYVVPVIYPVGLTRTAQFAIAVLVIVTNVVIYGWLIYRAKRSKMVKPSKCSEANRHESKDDI